MIQLNVRTPSLIETEPDVAPPLALPDRIYATLKKHISKTEDRIVTALRAAGY